MTAQKIWARVVRVLRSWHPSFACPDDAWVKTQLPASEYAVYAAMDPRDRDHAVRTARALLRLQPDSSQHCLWAALLHDCGKQVRPYKLWERIWVGLRNQPNNNPLPQDFDNLSAAQVRWHHPGIGAALILKAGGNARVAEIVAHHHQPNDEESAMIHAIDDLE